MVVAGRSFIKISARRKKKKERNPQMGVLTLNSVEIMTHDIRVIGRKKLSIG